MFSHRQVWDAIDQIAEEHGMTASGLAKRAGLDSTTFNKSKRISPDGRERWPSTESISKILRVTGEPIDQFAALVDKSSKSRARRLKTVPLIGFAQAGRGGLFDDGGFPTGEGWEQILFPNISDENSYALQISGDSMEPAFRSGDTIIVSPNVSVRVGDRVVVKTVHGEVMAKVLKNQNARRIELESVNPEHGIRSIDNDDIIWMSRIIWASQ